MFGAGRAFCAGSFKPSAGGGPSTTPSYAAAGTGDNAAGSPTPSYPANTSGQLFVLHALMFSSSDTLSVSGWTVVPGAPITNGTLREYVLTRDTRATGSDSGTVTVTNSGSSLCFARIYAFSNVATSSFIESFASTTAASGTIGMPSVTAGGSARLAVCFIGTNNDAGMASATGESGGDWTEAVAEHTSGVGAGIQIQTASLSGGGTISGGSAVVSGNLPIAIGFALVGV